MRKNASKYALRNNNDNIIWKQHGYFNGVRQQGDSDFGLE